MAVASSAATTTAIASRGASVASRGLSRAATSIEATQAAMLSASNAVSHGAHAPGSFTCMQWSSTLRSQSGRASPFSSSSFFSGGLARDSLLSSSHPVGAASRLASTFSAHASSSDSAASASPIGSASAPRSAVAGATPAVRQGAVLPTSEYTLDDSSESSSSDSESDGSGSRALEALYEARAKSGLSASVGGASAGSGVERGFPRGLTSDSEAEVFDSDDEASSDEEGEVVLVDVSDTDVDRDELAIESLGLATILEQSLLKRGIARLFPIQHAVLAPSMEGRDIIARAKTGTGKTLAFGIPILERITREIEENNGRRPFRAPRCLVLAPTRELAKQVEREFCESAPNLSTACVYGGVSIDGQMRQLKRGVDVVVGTPGRLIDLIERGTLSLREIQFMVLDEADQMLAVGFEEDVERIMENLPEGGRIQMSLFSATMPSWVKKLSRKYLTSPLTIDLVGEKEEKLAEGIRLLCVRAPNASKRSILVDLITVHALGGKTIVFTQTKKDADEVAMALGRSVGCEALHGDIPQQQRERTLQAFRDGRFVVLVATDVAARGLDIPNVDLVIHYEIPNDPETFVHRSGRTGRAGKTGCTILMYTDSQLRSLRMIERDIGCKFEKASPPHPDDVLQASANQSAALISRVHPELAESFLETAEKLLEERGPMALAAAIAHLSGFSQPPAARSLLTHEEGYVTVRVIRTAKSRNGPLISPRAVMGTLGEICRRAADNVGKIKILGERDVEGAVFDLPEDVAKELLSLQIDNGDVFDIPRQVRDTSTHVSPPYPPALSACLAHPSPVLSACLAHPSPVLSACLAHPSPVLSACLAHPSPVLSACLAHPSPVLSACLAHPSPVLSACLAHPSPVLSACLAHPSPALSACLAHPSPALSACLAHPSPVLSACLAHPSPVLSACLAHPSPVLSACLAHPSPVLSACLAHPSPVLSACLAHPSPVLSACLAHPSPALSACLAHPSPALSACLAHPSPALSACLAHPSPALSACLAHPSPVLSACLAHPSPVLSACLAHPSPVLSACLAHPSPVLSACLAHPSPVLSACLAHPSPALSACLAHPSPALSACLAHPSPVLSACLAHPSPVLSACLAHPSPVLSACLAHPSPVLSACLAHPSPVLSACLAHPSPVLSACLAHPSPVLSACLAHPSPVLSACLAHPSPVLSACLAHPSPVLSACLAHPSPVLSACLAHPSPVLSACLAHPSPVLSACLAHPSPVLSACLAHPSPVLSACLAHPSPVLSACLAHPSPVLSACLAHPSPVLSACLAHPSPVLSACLAHPSPVLSACLAHPSPVLSACLAHPSPVFCPPSWMFVAVAGTGTTTGPSERGEGTPALMFLFPILLCCLPCPCAPQLPTLVDDDVRGGGRDRDNYGRFGARGGDRGRGGGDRSGSWGDVGDRRSSGSSSGGGSRFGGDRDRFSSRDRRPAGGGLVNRRNFTSDAWESEDSDGYYTPSPLERTRSAPSRSGGDYGSYGRGGGGAGGGGFSGVCFLCKQPGHRAADCPVVAGR
ncbi:unnamed protein product [Closterium sp. Naga37s-1]|nr:unnamed protein product [Closterium sp. Naga37s-1]